MTSQITRYRIRDDQLPDRPPLALADTFFAAPGGGREVLHRQFRDQINGSGEGGTHTLQCLTIDELNDAGETVRLRYLSSISGP